MNGSNRTLNNQESKFPENKYYSFLDSLRGISILWVIIHHIVVFFPMHSFNLFLLRFAYLGFLGVDLFFVTSGFLISGLLKDDFLQGQVHLRRFYIRRCFKILPHYYLIILLGLVLAKFFTVQKSISLNQLLSYLMMMQSYLKEQFTYLAHLWSISIEEHFYLIYPVFLLLIAKIFNTRGGRLKGILISLCLLIFLGNMIRYYYFQNIKSYDVHYYQMTHVRFDALLFGCFLRFSEDWFHNKRFYGLVFLFLTMGILNFFFFEFSHLNWFHYTLAYWAAGGVISSALCGVKPICDLGKISIFRWIGKNSYGIYLWHYILIFPIIRLLDNNSANWEIMFLYIILSIACGVLSTVTFERFFLRFRNYWAP